MDAVHHFQHHIGDYDSATTHLSWDEDMAYTRLLRAYYRNEKPLPNDIDAVCRIARARSKDERAAVQTVLEEFFTLFPNGWRNKRADVEIERFQAKSAKAKLSANARWEEEKTNALAMRSHCDGNALAMLTANRQPPTIKTPLPPKGGTPKTAGISKDDLAEVAAIQRWLARRGKNLGLRNDHAVLTMLVAASERAIEVGDDPVGLFLSLAKDGGKGDWSKISGEQHDRAKQRMRNHIPGAALAETNGVPNDD